MKMKERYMKKLLVALAALAATALLSVPAFADGNGAQTFTDHLKGVPINIGPDPCPGAPPFDVILTANAVEHGTINQNGSWFTMTMTGPFTDQHGFTGHFTAWFGDENNPNNEVQHGTIDAHGTFADGTPTSLHANFTMNVHANGTVTASVNNMRCG